MKKTTPTLLALLTALALVAAACGSSSSDAETDTSTDSETTQAETEAEAETEPEAEAEPEAEEAEGDLRIVSLSPTHTEIMFAIGAGDMLVAVDDNSNYPAEALDLPNELSGFEPNVEAIAGFEPDLVLIAGDFSGLGDQLSAIDIESWDGPAALTLDDTFAQIEQLGALTGHVGEAAELVLQMQTDIDEILASAPAPEAPIKVYHELDPSYYSADSTTFIGSLYTMLGLENVADLAEGETGGYPQLNAEFLVANSPDMIFLADTKCCAESAETVSARDGWSEIAAVQAGNIFEMDDDIASRWGPRVVDYLAAVVDALDSALVEAN